MRRLIVIGFWFMVVIGFAQGSKRSYKQMQKAIKEAKEYIAVNRLEQALQLLKPYLKEYPTHPQLNYLVGFCHFALGHHEEALIHLERAYKAPSKQGIDISDLQWWYARSLLLNEKPQQALKVFQQYKKEQEDKKQQAIVQRNYKDTARYARRIQQATLYIHYCQNAIHYLANPVNVEIRNLGPMINSRYPDFGPVITADESQIFFTSRRPGSLGEIAADGFYPEDIYTAYRDENGKWQKAENIGKPINTEEHDATIALSADGRMLFIYKAQNNGDIFFSERRGGQWSKPVNLNQLSSDNTINTWAWEPSVCISADGKELFFVSDRLDRKTKKRHRDIFHCYRLPNGKWSKPKRLPFPINTPYDEDAPFLHPDGKTLYFSSNRPASMGGFDIFYSVRDEQGNWSKPVNLGYPINTPDNDLYFVLSADGKHGYYASRRKDSYGAEDIYLVDFTPMLLAAEKEKEEKEEKKDTVKGAIPRSTVTLLKGYVMDAKKKTPLEAKIILIDLATRDTYTVTYSDARTGRYLVTLVPGKNYAIFAQATGYMDYSKNIVIPPQRKEYVEIIEHIHLEPIAVGSKAILRNVFFDFGKATLRPESMVELDKWVDFLKAHPEIKIEIGGHTDVRGSAEYNKVLSTKRAKAVYDYFLQKGIPAERMTYKGYGETQPITTEMTEEAHQLNRRVEIKIIEE